MTARYRRGRAGRLMRWRLLPVMIGMAITLTTLAAVRAADVTPAQADGIARGLGDLLIDGLFQRITTPNAQQTVPGYTNAAQPTATDSLEVGFAKVIRDKALRIRDGIRARNAYGGPPSLDEDIQMLRNTSGLPIYRLIEASAYQKYPGVSETLLMSYCDAMAVELVSHYIQDMAANLDKVAGTAEISGPGGKVKLKHVEYLRARAFVLAHQAAEARKAVYAVISAQTGVMTQLLHVEKALYGNLSADVAANLRFGQPTRSSRP